MSTCHLFSVYLLHVSPLSSINHICQHSIIHYSESLLCFFSAVPLSSPAFGTRFETFQSHLVHAAIVQTRDPLFLEGFRVGSFEHGEVADASLKDIGSERKDVQRLFFFSHDLSNLPPSNGSVS